MDQFYSSTTQFARYIKLTSVDGLSRPLGVVWVNAARVIAVYERSSAGSEILLMDQTDGKPTSIYVAQTPQVIITTMCSEKE